ncbi:MAG: CRISPR-associated protein Csx14 [Candidatus Micrarchaeaceae archaeon]
MGTTPMVATEMYRYLYNGDPGLNDMILMYTELDEIITSTYASATAIKSKYPKVRIHYSKLPFEDIKSENELYTFLDVLGSRIKLEKENYNVSKIYVNLSGARKVQAISVSAFAALLGIDELWNVINIDITDFNYLYEQNKNIFKEFMNGENLDAYMAHRDILDAIFYPDPNKLTFIKVPFLKLPRDDMNQLKKLLKGGYDLTHGDIPDFKLDAFIQSELITNNKKRSTPTRLGEIFYKFL